MGSEKGIGFLIQGRVRHRKTNKEKNVVGFLVGGVDLFDLATNVMNVQKSYPYRKVTDNRLFMTPEDAISELRSIPKYWSMMSEDEISQIKKFQLWLFIETEFTDEDSSLSN